MTMVIKKYNQPMIYRPPCVSRRQRLQQTGRFSQKAMLCDSRDLRSPGSSRERLDQAHWADEALPPARELVRENVSLDRQRQAPCSPCWHPQQLGPARPLATRRRSNLSSLSCAVRRARPHDKVRCARRHSIWQAASSSSARVRFSVTAPIRASRRLRAGGLLFTARQVRRLSAISVKQNEIQFSLENSELVEQLN